MTPEEKKLDKYYLKKFNWTLEEVNRMFESQGNVCYICKRPPGERRMAVDHDHAFDRMKITVSKEGGKYWHAVCEEANYGYTDCLSRKSAKERVRMYLRRRSVRGGLCMRCNKGIQMFEDSKAPLAPAERFDRAAKYFRDFRPLSEQHEIHKQPALEVA